MCLCGVLHYRQAALQRSQDGGPSGDKDGENDNGDTIVDPFKPISVREQRVKVSVCVCVCVHGASGMSEITQFAHTGTPRSLSGMTSPVCLQAYRYIG